VSDPAGVSRGSRFRVSPAYAGYRLDQFLMRMIPKLSRNRIQRAISERVRLSWDAPVKPSTPVRQGGEVLIADPEIVEQTIEFDPAVLFEDDDILAINKPAGVVVHPTHNHLRNTVIGLLRRQRDESELSLAHRLDAETTGVLLLSRRRWAARKLQTSFERGRVDKIYLALVFGVPPSETFTVDLPLGYLSVDGVVYRQTPQASDAKPCETRFRIVSRHGRFTLLEAQLLTGRRHQIRAHLAQTGHPVVGDKLYGLDDSSYRRYLRAGGLDREQQDALVAPRCLLHCRRLEIPHPRNQERVVIEAPTPADLEEQIRDAGGQA